MKALSILTILLIVFLAGAVAAQTPQAVEDELLEHFKILNEASSYGGNSDSDIQDRENESIYNLLVKHAGRHDILEYAFPKLSEEMMIRTSKDGNFRSYSWDCECGGTMHNFYTVFQYLSGQNVKVHAEPFSMDVEDRGVGAFVHDIFQMPLKRGTVYLTVSTFIGSTSLNGQSIDAWKIEGGKLIPKAKLIKTKEGVTDSISFDYDFFSVVDHPERPVKLVVFDEGTRSFKFPVVLEDKGIYPGKVTDKFITYKFNGKYFEKTK